ncbi:MAG: hypothetical protein MHPDNHAH_02835 [Anaerolineales bacterium]|nr:hypothetical protein [Anaerolineales bacterium]
MTKIQHPWQVGPTELIEFALERMHKAGDFDRRLAFLILDVGIETLFKTYLTLPEGVTHFQLKRGERLAVSEGNFHELLRGVQSADPKKAAKFNFAYLEYYHNLRNTLYHQGNQVTTIPMNQLEGYMRLAVELLHTYLDVDLSTDLETPQAEDEIQDAGVADSAEVKVSFGRFRIERLTNNAVRALSLDNNAYETPVKPFLRAVVDELSLPVSFANKSGVEKTTRALGRGVIKALKPAKSDNGRLEFWKQLIDKHKRLGTFFSNISPTKESWIQTSSGKSGIYYAQIIMMSSWRVELFIGTPTQEVNKRFFDELFESREEIESAFGKPLDWQRLEARQGCRICYSVEGKGLKDKTEWNEIQDQMISEVYALRNALQDRIEKLK